jgi:predicted kinase
MLAERAQVALRAGHSVIADAAFLQPADRAAIEGAAAQVSVPFVGLWLEASASVLTSRVEARSGDASDADARVVLQQLRQDMGAVRWQRLDASGAGPVVLADARRRLSLT